MIKLKDTNSNKTATFVVSPKLFKSEIDFYAHCNSTKNIIEILHFSVKQF